MKTLALLFLFVMIICSSAWAASVPLVNPSFEEPACHGVLTFISSVPGWTFDSLGVAALYGDYSEGAQAMYIGACRLYQEVAVTPDTSYIFKIDVKENDDGFLQLYADYNGQTIANKQWEHINVVSGWQTYSLAFATPSNVQQGDVVRLGIWQLNGSDFTIDNAKLDVTTVPEPSSIAAIAGLLACTLTSLRRNRN